MEHRRDIQSPLQSALQTPSFVHINCSIIFIVQKFPFLPDVNELELLVFVKHMKCNLI